MGREVEVDMGAVGRRCYYQNTLYEILEGLILKFIEKNQMPHQQLRIISDAHSWGLPGNKGKQYHLSGMSESSSVRDRPRQTCFIILRLPTLPYKPFSKCSLL